MGIRKIVYSFLVILFILLFTSFRVKKCNKEKEMLLLYVTLKDSFKLYENDTNWINKNVCLQLKIDTVNLVFIDEFKDRKRFLYKNQIFNKRQLFDIKSYQYLVNFHIKSFSITCTGAAFEPPYVQCESNCISQEQEFYLKEYWKASKRFSNKQFKVYFCNIIAYNNKNKKIIDLNDVVWVIPFCSKPN